MNRDGLGPIVDLDRRNGQVIGVGDETRNFMARIEAIRDRALAMPQPPPPSPEELRAAEETEWLSVAKNARVWRRFWPAAFEASTLETEGLRAAREFVDAGGVEQGACLLLGGPTSVGKTWAAVCILRAHRARVGIGGFLYFPDLAQMLLGAKSDEGMELAKGGGLVVLDDFGTEYVKKGGALEAKVDAIFAYRAGNMLPTVVTTNLTTAMLHEHVTERVVERLREWAQCYNVGGPSLRQSHVERPGHS